MDDDDSPFLLSVDELGLTGLWASVREAFESRLPLRNVTLRNKAGRPVVLDTIPAQFLLSSDRRLRQLQPYASSQVTWARIPYAHILLVSTADVNDYRASVKAGLRRAISEVERDWGSGAPGAGPRAHWVIVYVRPANVDPQDKGAKKVFEKLIDDFGPLAAAAAAGQGAAGATGAAASATSMSRLPGSGSSGGLPASRIVRLDMPPRQPPATGPGSHLGPGWVEASRPQLPQPQQPAQQQQGAGAGYPGVGGAAAPGYTITGEAGTTMGGPGVLMLRGQPCPGLAEVEAAVLDAVRASFESRQDAYVGLVQRLSNERLQPDWQFAGYFVCKDSYGLMLEGAGMYADALQEYLELEAVYSEALERGAVANSVFGADAEGEDISSLVTVPWRSIKRSLTRRPPMPPIVFEFRFRQYLFATQTRLLLRMGQPVTAAQQGAEFVRAMMGLIEAHRLRVDQQQQQQQGGPQQGRAAGGGQAGGQPPYQQAIHPLFSAAWGFAASIAIVNVVAQSAVQSDEGSTPAGTQGSGAGGGGGDTGSPLSRQGQQQQQQQQQQGQAWAGSTWEGGQAAGGGGGGTGAAPSAAGGMRLADTGWGLAQAQLGTIAGASAGTAPGYPSSSTVAGLDQDGGFDERAGLSHREQAHRRFFLMIGHLLFIARQQLVKLAVAAQHDADASVAALTAATHTPGVSGQKLRPSPAGSTGSPGAGGTPPHLHDSSTSLSHLVPTSLIGTPATPASRSGAAGAAPNSQGYDPASTAWRHGSEPGCVDTTLWGYFSSLAALHSEGLGAESEAPRFEATPTGPQVTQKQLLMAPLTSPLPPALRTDAFGSAPNLASYQQGAPYPVSSGTVAEPDARSAGLPPTGGGRYGGGSAGAGNASPLKHTSQGAGPGFRDLGTTSRTGSAQQLPTLQHGAPDGRPTLQYSGSAGRLAASGLWGPGAGAGDPITTGGSRWTEVPLNPELSGAAGVMSAGQQPGAPAPGMSGASAAGARGGAHHRAHSSSGGMDFAPPPVSDSSAIPAAPRVSSVVQARPSAAAAVEQQLGGLMHKLDALASKWTAALMFERPPSSSLAPAPSRGSSGQTPSLLLDPYSSSGGSEGGSLMLSFSRGSYVGITGPSSQQHHQHQLPPFLAWVGDWRLRAALSSPTQGEHLLLVLTQLAASCWVLAGRRRTASLLYADMALVLLRTQQGAPAAQQLLEAVCAAALEEGWVAILGMLLPQVLRCQMMSGATTLVPQACMQLLGLPQSSVPEAERLEVMQQLLSWVMPVSSLGAPNLGGPSQGQIGGGGGGMLEEEKLQLHSCEALQVSPAPGSFSWLDVGSLVVTQEEEDVPDMQPPPRVPGSSGAADKGASSTNTLVPQSQQGSRGAESSDAAAGQGLPGTGTDDAPPGEASAQAQRMGAQVLRVGELALVTIDVWSNLPAPVSCSQTTLVLGTLEQTPLQELLSQQHHHHQLQLQPSEVSMLQGAQAGFTERGDVTGDMPAGQLGHPTGRQTESRSGPAAPVGATGGGLGSRAESESVLGGPTSAPYSRSSSQLQLYDPQGSGPQGPTGPAASAAGPAAGATAKPPWPPGPHHQRRGSGGSAPVTQQGSGVGRPVGGAGAGAGGGTIQSTAGPSRMSMGAPSPSTAGGGPTPTTTQGQHHHHHHRHTATTGSLMMTRSASDMQLQHAASEGLPSSARSRLPAALTPQQSDRSSGPLTPLLPGSPAGTRTQAGAVPGKSQLSQGPGHPPALLHATSSTPSMAATLADGIDRAAMVTAGAAYKPGAVTSLEHSSLHAATNGWVAWVPGADVSVTTLVSSEHLGHPHQLGSDADASRRRSVSAGGAAAVASANMLIGAPGGSVILRPGLTRLTFMVSPLRPGLCYARALQLQLGTAELSVPMVTPGALGSHFWDAWRQGEPGAAKQAVLLVVRPPEQRASVGAVLPGGCLVASSPWQWVGVLVAPHPNHPKLPAPHEHSPAEGTLAITSTEEGKANEAGEGAPEVLPLVRPRLQIGVRSSGPSTLHIADHSTSWQAAAAAAAWGLGPATAAEQSLAMTPAPFGASGVTSPQLPGSGMASLTHGWQARLLMGSEASKEVPPILSPTQGGGHADNLDHIPTGLVAAAAAAAAAAAGPVGPNAPVLAPHELIDLLQELATADSVVKAREAAQHLGYAAGQGTCRVHVTDVLAAAAAAQLGDNQQASQPAVASKEAAQAGKGEAVTAVLPRGGGAGGGPSAFAAAAQLQGGSGSVTPSGLTGTQALAAHKQQQQAGWGLMARGALDMSTSLGQEQVVGPVIVWLPVSVPPAQLEPLVVTVVSLDAVSNGEGGGRNGTHSKGNLLDGGSGQGHYPAPATWPPGPLSVAELAVALEHRGTDGCWRSHSSVLQLPITTPFSASLQAYQLPGSGPFLVSVCLTYTGSQPATLHVVHLEPQGGLTLSQGGPWGTLQPMSGPQLPLVMYHGTQATLTLCLVTSAEPPSELQEAGDDDRGRSSAGKTRRKGQQQQGVRFEGGDEGQQGDGKEAADGDAHDTLGHSSDSASEGEEEEEVSDGDTSNVQTRTRGSTKKQRQRQGRDQEQGQVATGLTASASRPHCSLHLAYSVAAGTSHALASVEVPPAPPASLWDTPGTGIVGNNADAPQPGTISSTLTAWGTPPLPSPPARGPPAAMLTRAEAAAAGAGGVSGGGLWDLNASRRLAASRRLLTLPSLSNAYRLAGLHLEEALSEGEPLLLQPPPAAGGVTPHPPSPAHTLQSRPSLGYRTGGGGAAGGSGGAGAAGDLLASGQHHTGGTPTGLLTQQQQQQQQQLSLHTLPFILQLPSGKDGSGQEAGGSGAPGLSIVCLGPWSARLGQPTAISWQITRCAAPASGSTTHAETQPAAAEGHSLLDTAGSSSVPGLTSPSLTRMQSLQLGISGGGGGPIAAAGDKHQPGEGGAAGEARAAGAGAGDAQRGPEVLYYEVCEPAALHQHKHQQGRAGLSVAAAPPPGSGGFGHDAGRHSCSRTWHLAVGCRGSVRLGRAPGSVAVVEAVVAPSAVGVLPPPVLQVRLGSGPASPQHTCESTTHVRVTL